MDNEKCEWKCDGVESEGVNVGKCPCPSGCCIGIFAVQRFSNYLIRKESGSLCAGGVWYFSENLKYSRGS